MRYGTIGSDVRWTRMKMSIGDGTVILYCRRVVRALRMLRGRFVGFPTEEEQQISMLRIYKAIGFIGCIGSLDGSLIQFDDKPMVNGEEMLGRKGFFGVRVLS